MPHIELGNISPINMITDPTTGFRTKFKIMNVSQAITSIVIPPDRDLLTLLTEVNACWASQSDEAPAWVTCGDDPDLESLLRRHFSTGERPEDWNILQTGDPYLVPVADGFSNVEVNTSGGEE